MSDPNHSCPACHCPSHGVGEYCDECAEDSESYEAGLDHHHRTAPRAPAGRLLSLDPITGAYDEAVTRRVRTYIGKVRDMHPLAAGEVTP